MHYDALQAAKHKSMRQISLRERLHEDCSGANEIAAKHVREQLIADDGAFPGADAHPAHGRPERQRERFHGLGNNVKAQCLGVAEDDVMPVIGDEAHRESTRGERRDPRLVLRGGLGAVSGHKGVVYVEQERLDPRVRKGVEVDGERAGQVLVRTKQRTVSLLIVLMNIRGIDHDRIGHCLRRFGEIIATRSLKDGAGCEVSVCLLNTVIPRHVI